MERRIWRFGPLLAAGLAAWMLGVGTLAAATFTVTAVGTTFQPATVAIHVNDDVNWTGITDQHTVTSNDGLFDSAVDFSFTFTQAGTFDYFCRVHAGMTGRVVVQAAEPTNTPTATVTPGPTNTPTATPRPLPTVVPGQPRLHVPVVADNGGIGSGDVAIWQGTFFPKVLEVPVGKTVVWHDQATSHTVTSEALKPDGTPLFDSGPDGLRPGQEFAFTFIQPGTYPYYCRFHGAPGGVGHAGTIVVR
jgi:plastocyanin